MSHSSLPVRSPSEISIGFSTTQSEHIVLPNLHEQTKRISSESSNHKILSDTFCLAVICKQHQRIAVQNYENKFFFLPFVTIEQRNVDFSKVTRNLLNSLEINTQVGNTRRLVDLYRMEQPKTMEYVTRYIFALSIDRFEWHENCCVDRTTTLWLTLDQITELMKSKPEFGTTVNLWGDECFRVLKWWNKPYNNVLREVNAEQTLALLGDNHMEASLLKNIGFEEPELKSLLNEFIVHCYPSETMSFTAFHQFCIKLYSSIRPSVLSPVKSSMIFNSFKVNDSLTLTFKEVIIGLCLMEENTIITIQNQTDSLALWLCEKRLPYIFRYYDTNQDGYLSSDELLTLLNDYATELDELNLLPVLFTEQICSHVTRLMEQFGQRDATGQTLLTKDQLKVALQQGLLRTLQATDREIEDPLKMVYHMSFDLSQMGPKFDFNRIQERSKPVAFCYRPECFKTCQLCAKCKFSFSDTIIHMSKTARIADMYSSQSLQKKGFSADIPETEDTLLADNVRVRLLLLGSVLFKRKFIEPQSNIDQKNAQWWFYSSKQDMIRSVNSIICAVTKIFASEKRVLEVNSPCYVFGDLHGNLHDLLTYSHNLWPNSPFFNTSKYLFLGDYVDRGDWGIEVCVLLFCLKILAPNNFHLVRGNHEVRDIQENFTFFNECNHRLTIDMWKMFNHCFDHMPVAAILDERIFCSHGGIPATVSTLDQLRAIPCPMQNPQITLPAWEIMWNDPVQSNEAPSEEQQLFTHWVGGFTANIKRGTGYIYRQQAISNFCRRNSLDFIFRAHEVFPQGICFFMKGQVVSVFSSSNYAGMNNRACALFVMQKRFRVIRIETD